MAAETRAKTTEPATDVEAEVLRRYASGADEVEPGLCCPTPYEEEFLDILPQEIVEKDYGCGNPSKYVQPGETVVDLGSGAGKICYILSQKVGAQGRVIGVDFNDKMLSLARKYQAQIAEKLGFSNVHFVKAKIQDLALDLDTVQDWLHRHPVRSVQDAQALEAECERLRREASLIATDSVDVIVSNCVLNLVRPRDKGQLFREMHRVLKPGGRAVISDVVCDEEPTPAILADPELWSGCIAGAFREDRFLKMFEEAGFYGMTILARQEEPWQVIDGVEFRSMTVQAFKGKEGPCWEGRHAVVYQGPWKSVTDDDGHTYHRGQRMAVCEKTYRIMTDRQGPYGRDMIGIPPHEAAAVREPEPFDCSRDNTLRSPRETKGKEYRATISGGDAPCCGPDGCC